MLIRRVNRDDLAQLLKLYDHLHEDDEAGSENLQRTWDVIVNNSNLFIYLVIESDGNIVGSCNLSLIPNLTRGGKSIALIENVVVHSNYRRHGYGRDLLEHALQLAKENNCYKVMLMTNSARKIAHRFYESLGFSSTDKVGYSIRL